MAHRWTEDELIAHEARCNVPVFDAETAWRIGRTILGSAQDRGDALTVRVTRGSHLLFHSAMEGTSPDQDDWLRRKVNTVQRFGHSSQYVLQHLEGYGDRVDREFGLDASTYVLAGGGVPVVVPGVGVVGVVAVAGLEGEVDHLYAVEGIAASRPAAVEKTGASRVLSGIPTVRSVDHVAYTVPDLDQAVTFFVEHLGGELVFKDGPFAGDYMRTKLAVDASARCSLAMIRMGRTLNLELFDYEAPERSTTVPRNSDVGGSHLALYVDDIDRAWAYLGTVPGVTRQEGPNSVLDSSPVRGQRWFYFQTPWGMQMEITSDTTATNYSGLPAARLAAPSTWDY